MSAKTLYDTGKTLANDFQIGDGVASTKSITANNAMANKPKLRYDHATSKWQYSNDGTNFSDIGSGGSKPDWTVSLTPKSMDLPATLSPEEITVKDIGGRLQGEALAYDDTLEEYAFGQMPVPAGITGSLKIDITLAPFIPHATNNEVQYRFEFAVVGPGDVASAVSWVDTFKSGVLVTSADGSVTAHSWSETLANLGIPTTGCTLYWALVIDHTDVLTNPLVGDCDIKTLNISVPRV